MTIDVDREKLAYTMMGRLKEEDLTQAQLARLTGATARQISFIRQGKNVEAGAVIAVCLALEIEFWSLFTGRHRDRIDAIRRHLAQEAA